MRNRSKISLNIYIIRHGKTPLNERRCFIGKNIDEGLSEGGKAKLRPLAELSNCDYVFSGKMKRCAETADILFGNRKITIIDGFMEYDFGDFEGKNHEELDGNKDYQKWLDSNGKSGIPNAEDANDFWQRSVKTFEKVIKETINTIESNEDKEDKENTKEVYNIAMVLHSGNIMAIMNKYFKGNPYQYQVGNGNGYLITIENPDESIDTATFCKEIKCTV